MQMISPVEYSPRLRALQEAIEADDRQALEAFWHEVAELGTPLIERNDSDHAYSLVTFLWRAEGSVSNVVVFGNWSTFDLAGLRMVRMGDTDCWYRTYCMPNELRASYWFAPNDSLVPWRAMTSYEEFKERLDTFRPDAMNPRRLVFPGSGYPNSAGRVASVVELSEAPPQPWSARRPEVPTGELLCHHLHSDVLNNERRVWTYLPPGFSADREPYDLLVVCARLA